MPLLPWFSNPGALGSSTDTILAIVGADASASTPILASKSSGRRDPRGTQRPASSERVGALRPAPPPEIVAQALAWASAKRGDDVVA